MEQILFLYFVRVITTIVGGYYLSAAYVNTKIPKLVEFDKVLHSSRTFAGGLGLVSLLIGVISLFTGYLIGDFFPAIINIVVGLILLYEYKEITVGENENKFMAFFRKWMVEKKVYWGFASFFFGIMHIFFAELLWI